MRNTALDHVQTRLSPVGQGRLPERPPPALMLGLQPSPELELDVLIHLPKMLSGVEPVKVSGPPAQDGIKLVQLLLQRGTRVAMQDRLHFVPYPLRRPPRRPAVAEAPLGITARRLLPKVHPQKLEALPSSPWWKGPLSQSSN